MQETHNRLRFNPSIGKILWSRKRQPTPIFLTGKSHGQKSLTGYSPRGCKWVEHDLATKKQLHQKYLLSHHYVSGILLGSLPSWNFHSRTDSMYINSNQSVKIIKCLGNYDREYRGLQAGPHCADGTGAKTKNEKELFLGKIWGKFGSDKRNIKCKDLGLGMRDKARKAAANKWASSLRWEKMGEARWIQRTSEST